MSNAPRAPQDRLQADPIRRGPSAPVPPIEAFGGGPGKDAVHAEVQGALWDAEHIAREERQAADRIAVDAKVAELIAEQTKLLYNPENGAMHRQGEKAFTAHGEVMEAWKAKVDALSQGLADPRQKQAFQKVAGDKRLDMDRSLQQHIAGERRRHDETTTRDLASAAGNAAVAGWADPLEVTKNLNLQEMTLDAFAKRAGLSPESRKQLIAETNSRTMRDVMFRALQAGADGRAKEYLEQGGRDFLVGKDLADVEAAVEKWSTAGKATRAVDGFMLEATSFKELMAKARAIPDDGVRAEAERYAKTRWAEREFEEREAKNARFTEGWKAIDQGGDQADSVEQAMGPRLWTSITDPKERDELARAWRIKKGLEAPVTDNAVYYALKTMGANEDTRREFLGENLLRYRHKMTQQDFQELSNFQTGLVSKDSKAQREAEGYLSKEETINQMANTITDPAKRIDFKVFIDGEIRRWQEGQPDKTKLPPKVEIEKMMRDVIKEKGGFFGLGKATREFRAPTNLEIMEAENRKTDLLQTIAQDEPETLEAILAALEKNRIDATPDKILELYEKGKVKGGR